MRKKFRGVVSYVLCFVFVVSTLIGLSYAKVSAEGLPKFEKNYLSGYVLSGYEYYSEYQTCGSDIANTYVAYNKYHSPNSTDQMSYDEFAETQKAEYYDCNIGLDFGTTGYTLEDITDIRLLNEDNSCSVEYQIVGEEITIKSVADFLMLLMDNPQKAIDANDTELRYSIRQILYNKSTFPLRIYFENGTYIETKLRLAQQPETTGETDNSVFVHDENVESKYTIDENQSGDSISIPFNLGMMDMVSSVKLVSISDKTKTYSLLNEYEVKIASCDILDYDTQEVKSTISDLDVLKASYIDRLASGVDIVENTTGLSRLLYFDGDVEGTNNNRVLYYFEEDYDSVTGVDSYFMNPGDEVYLYYNADNVENDRYETFDSIEALMSANLNAAEENITVVRSWNYHIYDGYNCFGVGNTEEECLDNYKESLVRSMSVDELAQRFGETIYKNFETIYTNETKGTYYDGENIIIPISDVSDIEEGQYRLQIQTVTSSLFISDWYTSEQGEIHEYSHVFYDGGYFADILYTSKEDSVIGARNIYSVLENDYVDIEVMKEDALPTPEVTATPTPVVTATPTPEVTATPTPVVTATPTPVVTATPTPSMIPVTKVILNDKKVTLGMKETYSIVAKLQPANSTDTITFSSSKSSVAQVNKETGDVVALAKGTTIITATASNGKKATCIIQVKKAPTSIRVKSKSIRLKKGKTYKISSSLPVGSASNQIEYSSTKKSVAIVTKNGIIYAKNKGTSIIKLKTYNGKTSTITVIVK